MSLVSGSPITTSHGYQDETDATKLAAFYAEKSNELAVLKRSAIVNQLYGGSKLVVEDQQPVRGRSDS